MNGLHDMGGLTCFGPVNAERDEPVFHAEWERRVFALNLLTKGAWGPIDRVRHAVERIHPISYLSLSYYEKWLAGIETLSQEFGILTAQEIETGISEVNNKAEKPPPTPEMIEYVVKNGGPATRNEGGEPVYSLGDKVKTITASPKGHTRLPIYARGRVGTIERYQGNHVFPDTVAHDLGENPQPLYCVKFTAKDLWGDTTHGQDCTFLDLWQSYLLRAE